MASPVPALGWRLTKLRSRHWAPSLSLSMSRQSKGADLHDGAGWGWLGPGLLAEGGEDHVTPLAPVTRRNHTAGTLMPTRATADRASWKKWPQLQKKRRQVCRSDEFIIIWNSSQDQEDRWEPLSSTLKVNGDVDCAVCSVVASGGQAGRPVRMWGPLFVNNCHASSQQVLQITLPPRCP